MKNKIKEYFNRGKDLKGEEKAKERLTILLEIVLVISFLLEIFKLVNPRVINAIFLPSLIIYAYLNLVKSLDKSKIISLILIFILSLSIYLFIISVF